MTPYAVFADLVLVTHALFIAFVVIGLILILIGLWRHWGWVRNFWFRLAHLVAIGIVVLQAWLGVLCPLTIVENALRQRAGEAAYGGSFVEHWLHRLIFYEAEEWVFTVIYTVFGALVAATWIFAKPVRRMPDRMN